MIQSILFDDLDWRHIMRMCGRVVSNDVLRPAMQMVKITCSQNRFKAIGCNGYQLSTVEGWCDMEGDAPEVTVLIPPAKLPAHTRYVKLFPSGTPKNPNAVHVLHFLDVEENAIDGRDIPVVNPALYPDFENTVIKSAFDNIDQAHHGEGEYMIAVNPRYLIAALDGLKDCESVILNFGSRVQPFIIRPLGEEQNRMALVLPVRSSKLGR